MSLEGLLVIMDWWEWQILSLPNKCILLDKIVNNHHLRALEINQRHIRTWEAFNDEKLIEFLVWTMEV